jgi:hypothetical protein
MPRTPWGMSWVGLVWFRFGSRFQATAVAEPGQGVGSRRSACACALPGTHCHLPTPVSVLGETGQGTTHPGPATHGWAIPLAPGLCA